MAHLSLRPNERIVREFTISAKFFWFLIFVGVVIGVAFPAIVDALLRPFGIAVSMGIWVTIGFVIAAALILYALYFRVARQYVVTNFRLQVTIGWLSQKSTSVDYEDMTDITVTQDIFERFILGIGRVKINTAGSEEQEIQLERVDDPYGIAALIRNQAEIRLHQLEGRLTAEPSHETHKKPPVIH